jgi:hypothetical protein
MTDLAPAAATMAEASCTTSNDTYATDDEILADMREAVLKNATVLAQLLDRASPEELQFVRDNYIPEHWEFDHVSEMHAALMGACDSVLSGLDHWDLLALPGDFSEYHSRNILELGQLKSLIMRMGEAV